MTRGPDEPDRIEDPDVEVGATVKAKRLRFKQRPETEVEVFGEVREPEERTERDPEERTEGDPEGRTELETESGSERHNLPDQVEPGVTYRDVRVRWRAAARLRDRRD